MENEIKKTYAVAARKKEALMTTKKHNGTATIVAGNILSNYSRGSNFLA